MLSTTTAQPASAARRSRDHHQQQHRRRSSQPRPDRIPSLEDYNKSVSDRKRRENAFNKPRESLPPFQEYHSGFLEDDDQQDTEKGQWLGSPFSGGNRDYSHTRHQSLGNFLTLRGESRTPSPVKTVFNTEDDEDMGFTGDNRSGRDSPRGLAGWLGGRERGLSVAESYKTESRNTTPNVSPRKTSIFPSDPTTPRNNSVTTTASRFMSAISKGLNLPQSPVAPPPPQYDDELCTLPLESALFPSGTRDPFSPAAHKNLQLSALGLLNRFQSAYRQKSLALKDLESDRAASRDELEEAVTRATHLRFQLEGMASNALEQDLAMRELMDQLMAEKKARQEERFLRRMGPGSSLDEGGSVSEDYSDRLWRASDGSFDTDYEDSVDESLFSRRRYSEEAGDKEGDRGREREEGKGLNAFQKIVRGVVRDVEDIVEDIVGPKEEGCRRCEGRDVRVAWETVGRLRDENRTLRGRVGELEGAVEGALDLVSGRGTW